MTGGATANVITGSTRDPGQEKEIGIETEGPTEDSTGETVLIEETGEGTIAIVGTETEGTGETEIVEGLDEKGFKKTPTSTKEGKSKWFEKRTLKRQSKWRTSSKKE